MIAGDGALWGSLVEQAVLELETKRRLPHMASHLKTGSRPPPFDRFNQRDRMALLTADGALLAGNSGSLLDGAAGRPLRQDGVVIGQLAIAMPSFANEVDQRGTSACLGDQPALAVLGGDGCSEMQGVERLQHHAFPDDLQPHAI